jgi:hypothetical protein
MTGCELHSLAENSGQVVGSYEYEPLDSIECKEFLKHLNNY